MRKNNFFLCFLLCISQYFSAQKIDSSIIQKYYQLNDYNKKTYILSDINITSGLTKYKKNQIFNFSNSYIGDKIQFPGRKINDIINNLWDTQLFSNISIYIDKIKNDQIFLSFLLNDSLEIFSIKTTGIESDIFNTIIKNLNIESTILENTTIGIQITKNLINDIKNHIQEYYINEGYPDVTVNFHITHEPIKINDLIQKKYVLNISVNQGSRIKIKKIIFKGNKELSSKQLKRLMVNTVEKSFLLNILTPSKYIEKKFEEDCNKIIQKYQSLGFRDVEIISKFIFRKNLKYYIIYIKIDEGQRYSLGDISFEGNFVFDNEVLQKFLKKNKKNNPYNFIDIKKCIFDYENKDSIIYAYLNKGYLFSNISLTEILTKDNKIDLKIIIKEGKLIHINKITLSGNDMTKDHVIVQKIKTYPGDIFSQEKIKHTIFHLSHSELFDNYKIIPIIKPNYLNSTVDIEWNVTEKNTSEFQLQAGYGLNNFIGTVSLNFLNFSFSNLFRGKFSKFLPQGDGEKLSLVIQGGHNFQSYGFTFTEPSIFNNISTSLKLEINFTKIYSEELVKLILFDTPILDHFFTNFIVSNKKKKNSLNISKISIGFDKQLTWPNDYFSFSAYGNYEFYNRKIYNIQFNNPSTRDKLNNLYFTFSLQNNSILPDPLFPMSGSEFNITGIFTLPFSKIEKQKFWNKFTWLEYFKIKFNTNWYKNIFMNFILKTSGEFGFISSYNAKKSIPVFQKFYLGGMEQEGENVFFSSKEYIPLRGYPVPKNSDKIINTENSGIAYQKISLEIRYPIVIKDVAKIWILSFFEIGNIIKHYKTKNYNNIFKIQKSAGVGVRLYTPIFGVMGLDFGYGFNKHVTKKNKSKWEIHFIIGRNI